MAIGLKFLFPDGYFPGVTLGKVTLSVGQWSYRPLSWLGFLDHPWKTHNMALAGQKDSIS
jgi:hypothetical protein